MINDIKKLNMHYKVHEFMKRATLSQKFQYLQFRANFIEEELTELYEAISVYNKEDIVDALIDIIVVSLGTLESFEVNIQEAWNEVLRANLDKEIGVNPTRENNGDLPDAIKPEGWIGPNHKNNTGKL